MQIIIDFLKNNWKQLGGFLIAVFTIWKYFDTRSRELAWRRTEFLINQITYMHSDNDISEILSILDGIHPQYSIDQIFGRYSRLDSSPKEKEKILRKFEKYLDFVHTLGYAALTAKTISLEEVNNTAGWYIQRIGDSKTLMNWCEENGYGLVCELVRKLK